MGRGSRPTGAGSKPRIVAAPGLGDRIREHRERLGLTQIQVGAGRLSGSYISQVERGLTRPSRPALEHIAERLGTTSFELGLVGKLPSPEPLSATTDALALLRAARAQADDREKGLLAHAEWVLTLLLHELAQTDIT